MTTLVAWMSLVVVALLVGDRLLERAGGSVDGPCLRGVLALCAGTCTLYVALLVLAHLGIPWAPNLLRGLLLLLGGLALADRLRADTSITDVASRRPGMRGPNARPRIASVLGVLVTLMLLALVVRWLLDPCCTMADVLYHWGIKADRFAVALGIDADFLRQPWNLRKHPDYPNLLPLLGAATAILADQAAALAMLLWGAFGVLAATLGAEAGLGRAGVDPTARMLTVLATTATVGMFAIGYVMAGSPDLWLAALPLVALPALVRSPATPAETAAADLHIGIVAATAVALKLEGLPLAASLCAVACLQRMWATSTEGAPGLGTHLRRMAPSLLRLLVPPLVTGSIWALAVVRWDLAQKNRVGGFDAERLQIVVETLGRGMSSTVWHGLSWMVLALPVLLFVRTTRPLATVLTLQAAFYGWIYVSTPVNTAFLVQSSMQRLLFHLVPTTLVLVVIALDGIGGKAYARTSSPPVESVS